MVYVMEEIGEKGGEKMSLEGIKQVTQTEESSQLRRAEAQAQAKKTVADARQAGEQAVAAARTSAEAQVREYMKAAEEKASKHAEKVVAETKQACDALQKAARGRKKDAAALIVRRVVNV